MSAGELQEQLQGMLLATDYGHPQLYTFQQVRADLGPASAMEGGGSSQPAASFTAYLRYAFLICQRQHGNALMLQ